MRFHTARQRMQFITAFQAGHDPTLRTRGGQLGQLPGNPGIVTIEQIQRSYLRFRPRIHAISVYDPTMPQRTPR